MKCLRGLSAHESHYIPRSSAPFLHCSWCNAWDCRLSFARHKREIASDENFGVSGYRQIRIDNHSAGVIDWNAEHFAEWGGSIACCPENCASRDLLIPNVHRIRLDECHHRARVNFHPKLRETLLRLDSE